MIVGAMATTELMRLMRRREGVILPLGLALFGALPILVGLAGPSDPFDDEIDTRVVMESLRSIVAVAEIVIVGILAHVLAATSLSFEHRRGSWSLLVQSASTPGRILAGKGLGILGGVAIAHLSFMLTLLTTTPLLTREPAAVAFEALAPLLMGIAALPGGFAEAQVRRTGRGYGAFRVINALQWISPVLILAALLAPLGIDGASTVVRSLAVSIVFAPLLVGLRETLPATDLFLALALFAHAGLGLLTWRLFVVSPRYA